MFAAAGAHPLAELYSPLHRLLGAGHISLAASFWALRVCFRMISGSCQQMLEAIFDILAAGQLRLWPSAESVDGCSFDAKYFPFH